MVKMSSKITTVAPLGCQSRLMDWMVSITMRANSSKQKSKSA
ncbi:Uncharacterised protein [Mycobacteroides abscessus subsp. abscessus]|nr:Uncharacterised protein [Mycobacteroides abscessus subsp. abscessus]